MPRQKVEHQQQQEHLILSELEIDQVAIEDRQILHPVDFDLPQDMQDPDIIMVTAHTDDALPRPASIP